MHIAARMTITLMVISIFIWSFNTSAAVSAWPNNTGPPLGANSSVDVGIFAVVKNESTQKHEIVYKTDFNNNLLAAMMAAAGAAAVAAFVGLSPGFIIGAASISGFLVIFNRMFYAPVLLLMEAQAPFPIVAVVGGGMLVTYMLGVITLIWRA